MFYFVITTKGLNTAVYSSDTHQKSVFSNFGKLVQCKESPTMTLARKYMLCHSYWL